MQKIDSNLITNYCSSYKNLAPGVIRQAFPYNRK